MHYIYNDYSHDRPVLLFECDAIDILDVDRQLKSATGIVAEKNPRVTVWSPDWRTNSTIYPRS
jgi:hypothetical protein